MTRTTTRTFVALITSLVVLPTSELARAGGTTTITSPAIYGGPGADLAFCAVRNVGKKPTSPELRILDESGNALVTTSESCNGTPQSAGTGCVLEPGKIFTIRADAPTGSAYACSATGKARSLRGSIHVGCCEDERPEHLVPERGAEIARRPRDMKAFVVGASTGIGLATAEKLAARGDDVVIFARREGPLAEATRTLEARRRDASQRVASRALDAADAARVAAVMEDVVAEMGPPDILVNCAGRAIPNYFDRIPVAQLEETLRQNVHTCWNTVHALVPHMKRRGGHIVNVSSLAGLIGVFGYTDYCAAKFAVIGFSDALRWELAPHRIAVSVLCPPDVDTPGLAQEDATKPRETRIVSEGARMLTPAAVADALLAGMAKRRFLIVPGAEGRLAHVAKRLLPGLVDILIARRLRGAG